MSSGSSDLLSMSRIDVKDSQFEAPAEFRQPALVTRMQSVPKTACLSNCHDTSKRRPPQRFDFATGTVYIARASWSWPRLVTASPLQAPVFFLASHLVCETPRYGAQLELTQRTGVFLMALALALPLPTLASAQLTGENT